MFQKVLLLTLSCLVFLAACDTRENTAVDDAVIDVYDPGRDYFSYANTDEFLTRSIVLDLDVDFERRQLHGSVVLTLDRLHPAGDEIVLDTRDLQIDAATFLVSNDDPQVADYELRERDAVMGSALHVQVPDQLATANALRLRLEYVTSPSASALQWLPAELTAGGEHPMMFSQSQAIHARSWIPLQDTPAVRVTYDATIRTPEGLLAVMSADNDPQATRGAEYRFNMPQPIPSYLIALAVGNLHFAPIGTDTGVYTEPELLDASVHEFAQTQEMLEIAERQFGPYQWGRYDLLVLPPSFPYGGMENPRLSFLTPSLLAGDRSLVSVVAHELAHSWSGNLVTNATWRDGWLNEGVTSYLEARLMEVIYDKNRVDEERVLGYRELLENFDVVSPQRQGLAPRFDSGDPDDFQGTIHYHKGQLLLQYLEDAFGRERFDAFLFTYFEDYAFETITTEVFLDYLDVNLLQAWPNIVSRQQVEHWLYQPGLPADAPIPQSVTLKAAAEAAQQWSNGEVDLDGIAFAEWSPQGVVHFLNSLPTELPNARLQVLDDTLGLSATRNAEIGRTWFIHVAKRRFEPAYEALELHLNRYGRMRLITPVYKALAENGADLDRARAMFANARGSYHPIAVARIERTLKAASVSE